MNMAGAASSEVVTEGRAVATGGAMAFGRWIGDDGTKASPAESMAETTRAERRTIIAYDSIS